MNVAVDGRVHALGGRWVRVWRRSPDTDQSLSTPTQPDIRADESRWRVGRPVHRRMFSSIPSLYLSYAGS